MPATNQGVNELCVRFHLAEARQRLDKLVEGERSVLVDVEKLPRNGAAEQNGIQPLEVEEDIHCTKGTAPKTKVRSRAVSHRVMLCC